MNSDPNNDLNSTQNNALHQVRSRALRTHGVRSRAHNAQVACMSRAQPVQVAHSACAGRAPSAQVVGASRNLLPLPSPRLGRDIISRPQHPGQLNQVATSIPCHDLPFAQPKQPKSRPQKWDRDTNFHGAARTMSRHQIDVATPLRPLQVATSKRVATPFFLPSPKPGRNTKPGRDALGD